MQHIIQYSAAHNTVQCSTYYSTVQHIIQYKRAAHNEGNCARIAPHTETKCPKLCPTKSGRPTEIVLLKYVTHFSRYICRAKTTKQISLIYALHFFVKFIAFPLHFVFRTEKIKLYQWTHEIFLWILIFQSFVLSVMHFPITIMLAHKLLWI